jgi:hypothetical protein
MATSRTLESHELDSRGRDRVRRNFLGQESHPHLPLSRLRSTWSLTGWPNSISQVPRSYRCCFISDLSEDLVISQQITYVYLNFASIIWVLFRCIVNFFVAHIYIGDLYFAQRWQEPRPKYTSCQEIGQAWESEDTSGLKKLWLPNANSQDLRHPDAFPPDSNDVVMLYRNGTIDYISRLRVICEADLSYITGLIIKIVA